METKLTKITPRMANHWLESNNQGNRTIRQERVKQLARAMAAGRWRQTHQGIAFDTEGNLIDGQHRLSAIATAGVTVSMLVTTGLSRESMIAMDRGAVRDVADTMRLLRGTENARYKVAFMRVIIGLTERTIDDTELDATIAKCEEHIDWIFALPNWTKLKFAPCGAALVFAHSVKPVETETFARAMLDPANLPSNSPIFRALDVLHGKRYPGVAARFAAFRAFLHCLRGWIHGDTMKLVRDTEVGLNYFRQLRLAGGIGQ